MLGFVNIAANLSRVYQDSIIKHNKQVEKIHTSFRLNDCIKFCGHWTRTAGVFLGLIEYVGSTDTAVKEHMKTNRIQETFESNSERTIGLYARGTAGGKLWKK